MNRLNMKLIALLCLILVVLTACTESNAQPQPQQTAAPAADPVAGAASSSCNKPPKQLTLAGKVYRLKSEMSKEEPGMKLSYMKCDKGQFTAGDADAAFTIYSAGNPATNRDILLMGNWGGTGRWSQALYSLDDQAPSKNETVGNDVRQPMDAQLTQEQVKGMFGDQYSEVIDAVTGEWKVWRYDVQPKSGYKYDVKNDTVDVQGIKNRDVKGQVFVTWAPDGKLMGIVYYGLKDGAVKAYYMNGFTEETVG